MSSDVDEQIDNDNEQVEDLETSEQQIQEQQNDSDIQAFDPESDDEEFAGFDEDAIESDKKTLKRKIVSDEEEEEVEHDEVEKEGEEEHDEVEKEGEEEHAKQTEEEEEEDGEPHETSANEQNEEEEEAGAGGGGEEEENLPVLSKKKERGPEYESDFDQMLKRKQAQNKKKYRRKNADSENITNYDAMISNVITEMKNAAAEDRAANEKNICTLKKLKMLPLVMNVLQKTDFQATLIELGILSAMAEWLAPLPDRSLPNIKIREDMINALTEFGEINADYLKTSGIGKAVMFLYKHPKETKQSKEKLEKLINSWSRPIFSLESNFKQLTKEERQQRDMEHVKSIHKSTSSENASSLQAGENVLSDSRFSKDRANKRQKNSSKIVEDQNKLLRPGDPGFCQRARVPVPSAKDYVVRPRSNVESFEMNLNEKKTKKSESRLDKHKKRFVDMKRQSKSTNKAVLMSIEGKRMSL